MVEATPASIANESVFAAEMQARPDDGYATERGGATELYIRPGRDALVAAAAAVAKRSRGYGAQMRGPFSGSFTTT